MVRDNGTSLCSMAIEYNCSSFSMHSLQNGAKHTLGMLDVIATFRDVIEMLCDAGCYWRRFGTEARPLDFPEDPK